MLRKPISTCYVCKYNLTLGTIKNIITDVQTELRLQWKSSRVSWAEENIFPKEENEGSSLLAGIFTGASKIPKDDSLWFLVGDRDRITVIPSYALFRKTWKKAFVKDPLEVDWSEFDIHSSTDMEYLISTVEMLEDQQNLWINDEYTRDHSVMRLFSRFICLIKRLLVFASNNSMYEA
jgi:hypothetical protein